MNKIILVFIFILAFSLRIFQSGQIPGGFHADEAALSYNAYSLLQTGKDEYGKSFPLLLKSFGDFKPALYSYLDIPFIKIFGLNEFAARLPSALFGSLTIISVYLLIVEITKKRAQH